MAFNIPFKTSAGVSIGDIITSARTVTEDGRDLLPLTENPRILTPTEETNYPILSSVLTTQPAWDKPPWVVSTALSTALTESGQFGVVADGSKMYFDDGTDLKQYVRATNAETTLIGGAVSDKFTSISCSADGQIVAVVFWDNSGTQFQLRISTDGGSSFTTSKTFNTGSAASDKGLVYVSADGSMVAAVVANGANALNYIRVDNPAGSVVPDVDTDITPNLAGTSINGDAYVSFSEDGQTFVISYATLDGIDEYITEYTEDSGASFTRINAWPLNEVKPSAFGNQWIITLDPLNPQVLLMVHNGASESAALYYSQDKGLTWKFISPPDSSISNTASDSQGGWLTSGRRRISFKNNYAIWIAEDQLYYLIKIPTTGQAEILEKVITKRSGSNNYLSIGWAADNLSFSIQGYVGTNEYPFSGVMKLGKYLPAMPLLSNSKLVADAQ